MFTKNKLILSCLIAIIPVIGFSQWVKDYKADDQLLREFSGKYPKSKEVCYSSENTVSFDIKKNKEINVTEHMEDRFVSNSAKGKFVKRISFDNMSKIENVKMFLNEGIRSNVVPTVSDAMIDGIFYHDTKIASFEKNENFIGERFGFALDKIYLDPKYYTTVFFHDSYPVFKKEITIIVPDWLDIEIIEYNFGNYDIKKEITTDKNNKIISYKATDLPPLVNEERSPGRAQIYPHLVMLFKGYKFEDQTFKLLASVEDLYDWYRSLVSDVDNDSEKLEPVVNQIIGNCDTDIAKVEALFFWVQDNIRYLAFENGIMGFKPQGAYEVYYNKYGDCKGKANLLKVMLEIAGFNSKLAWIGTNIIPYDYSIPSLIVDNHMICVLDFEGKRYFLDPTEEFIALNDYANRIQGRQVLIENGTSYILDTVPKMSDERNKCFKSYNCALVNDKIVGNVKVSLNGEDKTGLLSGYHSANITERDILLREYLKNFDKNITVSNLEQINFDDRRKPLEINYEFSLSNRAFVMGNSLYLNFETDKELYNLIMDSTRVNDYVFGSDKYYVTEAEFEIPDNYDVEYLPESLNITNENYSFVTGYTKEGNKIKYKKEIVVVNPVLEKKSFAEWNDNMIKLKKFYNDQIVLHKE